MGKYRFEREDVIRPKEFENILNQLEDFHIVFIYVLKLLFEHHG